MRPDRFPSGIKPEAHFMIESTMRSLNLVAPRTLELAEAPKPANPEPHEVLLRVVSVGLCGSDVHYFANGKIGSQVISYPFRLGHEFAARVEAVGKDVIRVMPGDLVAVDPAMSCNICDQCRMGRPHTCRQLRFLGCPGQAEGSLCDFMLMPEETCFTVPLDMDIDIAALVEPLSIGAYAARLASPMMGAHIAILGAGPIGLSVLLATRAAGAEKVYITEPVPARRALAKALGANWVGHPDDDSPVEALQAMESLGLDVVFECCGKQQAIDQGIQMLTPGGKLMLIGIPSVDRISFPIDTIRRHELALQNVRRQNGCMREAIQLGAQHEGWLRQLITHVGSPADAQRFFEDLESYRNGIIKAVIHF